MKKTMVLIVAGSALLVNGGCAMFRGGPPTTPDEFRVVTKAPLTLPPEYSLRPPQAGQAQPAEVDPALAGSVAAFGTTLGAEASSVERALVAAAGANAVSPVIRAQVDYEEAKIIRKDQSLGDRILFWRKDEAGEVVADNATGDAPVTIERGGGARMKLPGT